MIVLTKKIATFAALAALSVGTALSGPAYAADMLQEPTSSTEVEFGTGWYLRGDIGHAITEVSADSNLSGVSGETQLGSPISFSVGAGYQLSETLRLEGAFNNFSGLEASSRSNSSCGSEIIDVTNPISGVTTQTTVPITGTCFFNTSASPQATSLMLNAYFDANPILGVTPYAGAGVGFAYVTWSQFEQTNNCIGISPADCGATGGAGLNQLGGGTFENNGEFVLAYNLMLGAAYNISDNLKLDFGYRYTNIGGVTAASAAANPGVANDIEVDSMNIHELRVGLRYEIW